MQILDCVIVGAGPAGLMAGVYMARYRRSVVVVHDGRSRALKAPMAHNVPGFPDGVSGPALLELMTAQLIRFGGRIETDVIKAISREGDGFAVLGEGDSYACRTVILATGVQMREVDLDRETHDAAVAAGSLRYCPVCDGYEATGKVIGVFGGDAHGAAEALFLRQYSDHVTLLAQSDFDLSQAQRDQLEAAGVELVAGVDRFDPRPDGMHVALGDGASMTFDVVYPALGCDPRSELAASLDLLLDDDRGVPADPGQRTNIAGVYAAGDLVEGLDQISVSAGQGAIAATKAHNRLRQIDGQVLTPARALSD